MPTCMSSLAGLLLVGVCLCISLVQADVKQLLAENEQQAYPDGEVAVISSATAARRLLEKEGSQPSPVSNTSSWAPPRPARVNPFETEQPAASSPGPIVISSNKKPPSPTKVRATSPPPSPRRFRRRPPTASPRPPVSPSPRPPSPRPPRPPRPPAPRPPAPLPPSPANNPYGTPLFKMDTSVTYSGDITWYKFPTKTMCGIWVSGDGTGTYAALAGPLNDRLNSPPGHWPPTWCSNRALVTGIKGSAIVTIIDMCPECALGSIDVTQEIFQQVTGDLIIGRSSVSWHFID